MVYVLENTRWFSVPLWHWLGLILAIPLAYLVGAIAVRVARGISRRTRNLWDDELLTRTSRPLRWLIALVSLSWAIDGLELGGAPAKGLFRLLTILAIAVTGWLLHSLVGFAAWYLEWRAQQQTLAEDSSTLRTVQTQVRVLQRVLQVVVLVVVAAAALLQIDSVRSLGVSLIASAGIAGVILGVAAQKPMAAVLAGIQISMTRPVRIGDTVRLEGQFGTIEEIRLTHVVLKIWDDRRLVVPMSRLLDQPIENWTKSSSALLGTVFLFSDPSLDMAVIRAEFDRILASTPEWDGRAKSLLVTDVREQSVELRALVSAADASALWTLRCTVREQLVAFLAAHEGGRYLPQNRLVLPGQR